jgi:hypothetical protein
MEVIVVVYTESSEIPSPITGEEIYLFINTMIPRFVNLYLSGRHKHIYIVNTEQSTRPIWSLIINHYIKMGITICDYDQYQTQIAQKLVTNHKVWYLPYQITLQEDQYLSSLIHKTTKRFNVAFCSTNKSKRRTSLKAQLEQRGLTVIDVTGWNQDRDVQIAQAQLLVNVHYDDNYQIFEHMRCDRWILSGMLVVSESSLSDPLLDCKDLVIIEPYLEMADKITQIIANYDHYYSQYMGRLLIKKKQIIGDRRKCLWPPPQV